MPDDPTSNEFSGFSRDVLFGTAQEMPRVVEIEIGNLQANPNQPRKNFDEEALDDLASSIEEQPSTVQNWFPCAGSCCGGI